ncbi:Threonine/homoserine efflux transporter RhtA [Halobiforma haloterrestris]|uniref:Threonine/homoserine efflux transporter RhtA n=1 Tax=Natronobacterium haloterrestre TaxID=148448 RepID=A0A1I1G1L4_NATHA|nr:DMT family transporter [Halobiforma haloterrestris]SFC05172.1 Threonine/homoserine efflux transporter RhtA [Halobiforma haloterrestris]
MPLLSSKPVWSRLSTYLFALAPLAAAALWGGLYVVSKWGFDAVPPLTLAFLRVAVGAAALLVVVRATAPRRRFSRRDLLGFAALGVAVAASLATQFLGTALTTASQGSLVTVLTPVFTILLGVSVLGERLSGRLVVGIVTATVGTVVVLSGQYDLAELTGSATVGIGMLLVASATWAVYTVFGKPLIERYSALETATYSCAVAVPILGALVPVEVATTGASLRAIEPTPELVVAVLYLGLLGTAAAWYLWYKGMEYVDASVVSAFFFAQPVVGALFGAAVLGESPGSRFVLGGAVMAAGIYLVSTTRASA